MIHGEKQEMAAYMIHEEEWQKMAMNQYGEIVRDGTGQQTPEYHNPVPQYEPVINPTGRSMFPAFLVIAAILLLVLFLFGGSIASSSSGSNEPDSGNGQIVGADNSISDDDWDTEDDEYMDNDDIEDDWDTDDGNTGEDMDTSDSDSEEDEYILLGSDVRYIRESELYSLSQSEVQLARNEIYARHGRKFDTEWIRNYFNSLSWYEGEYEPEEFDKWFSLNDYEKANIDTIVLYEKEMGYR